MFLVLKQYRIRHLVDRSADARRGFLHVYMPLEAWVVAAAAVSVCTGPAVGCLSHAARCDRCQRGDAVLKTAPMAYMLAHVRNRDHCRRRRSRPRALFTGQGKRCGRERAIQCASDFAPASSETYHAPPKVSRRRTDKAST